VLIAMTPALVAAVYIFGIRALWLSVVCMVSCCVFESLYRRLVKKDKGHDPSPAVTGLLLAFCLPVTLPYYMAVIGCFIAIVIVKQLFGGLGQNFANPAITARIALFLSFTSQMTNWEWDKPSWLNGGMDAVTGATPLDLEAGEAVPDMMDLFLGFHGGTLGETSALALLIGGLILIAFKVIHPITPLAYIGTVAIGAWFAGADIAFHVLTGGLILGAFFMATDYATTPISTAGKLIFGVGCGVITLVIRFFSDMPEGVSFAILIMNILTYYIDKITTPSIFGVARQRKGGENEKP